MTPCKAVAFWYRKTKPAPGQLTIHADRGPSMRSKTVAQLLADLGITKTHSRPYTSNDNPFSESQFKTLKYHPCFPGSFGSQEDARAYLNVEKVLRSAAPLSQAVQRPRWTAQKKLSGHVLCPALRAATCACIVDLLSCKFDQGRSVAESVWRRLAHKDLSFLKQRSQLRIFWAACYGRTFFPWYNEAHRHCGIGLMTPEQVHCGIAPQIVEARFEVMTQGVKPQAFLANPARWNGRQPSLPKILQPHEAVWINPPTKMKTLH